MCDQKSPTWLQRRKLRLTASQIATAIGINPYETRDNLVKQYSGVGCDARDRFTGNDATRHGEKYEDEAVALYEQQHEKIVLCFGLMPFVKYGDFLGGSVDGITADGILVEVKCPYRRKPKNTIPAYYEPQIQSMMHGFQIDKCHFIEYVPETQWAVQIFNMHDIGRDPEFMSTHYASLREFWHRVCCCRQTGVISKLYDNTPKQKRKRTTPAPRGLLIRV